MVVNGMTVETAFPCCMIKGLRSESKQDRTSQAHEWSARLTQVSRAKEAREESCIEQLSESGMQVIN